MGGFICTTVWSWIDSRWEEPTFVNRFRIQGLKVMRRICKMRVLKNGATHLAHFI